MVYNYTNRVIVLDNQVIPYTYILKYNKSIILYDEIHSKLMIKECKYKEILDKLNINDQQIDEFTEFDDIIEILDDVQQSNKMPALSVEFILDMYKLDRSKLPNLSKYKIFDIVNRAENTDQIVQIIRQYASYCCKLV